MCYMLAVGKNASADGSVMVARNCDSNSTEAQQIVSVPRRRYPAGTMIRIPDTNNISIPQVEETYAYTAILRVAEGEEIPMAAGGINEFQLSAGASTGGWVKPEVARLTPWPDTVLGDYVMTLVLERCKTAREAVQWLGKMTEEYGARTDNYILADPNEVWLFEQYQGYHWAAARVPDDCFVVEANSFRLAEINPDDPDNYMCDPDLIPFAIKHGLWDPNSGEPFHASRAYGTNEINRPRGANGEYAQPYYSLHRIWRGISLLAPSTNLDPYEPTKEYPLFVKPDRKLTPEDLINVLKDTYEGTELDEYSPLDEQYPTMIDPVTGHYRYSPAWCKSRIIGCPQTITSWVTQSRSWLPNEIGGLLWAGLAATAASPHIPFYAGNTRTPVEYRTGLAGNKGAYTKNSAYWLFENIGNLMNLFYQGTVDLVKPVWCEFDRRLYDLQPVVEETALKLYKEDPARAVKFLTTYSNGVAHEALEVGEDMLAKMFTRIALVNNPQTSRGYEDPKTWKSAAFIY
ncbi:MAG TPA: C69 family dipeptidase [Chloroflexi bacterium]|nr:C69 family dipeptidase [Chloroflexota bacterium]